MFNNDVSYLYSDECLTPSNSNDKQFSGRVSKYSIDRPVYQRRSPILTLRHRSKHILFFRGDIHRCERNRLAARRLREKRQLFKNILLKRIQQLESERLYLENNLRQCEVYKRDLKMDITNRFCLNTLAKLLLMEKETIPFSDDLEFSDKSTTNVFDLNDDSFDT
jgi:hypothetical protein